MHCYKKQKVLKPTLSTIWKNTDGGADQYRCASSLHLISVFSQSHSIKIDQGISEPGHGKEVFDGINAIDKLYMYQLIYNVQLPGSRKVDSQNLMYSCTPKNDVSLAKEFQNICLSMICKHGVIDNRKYRNISSKRKCAYREYHVQDNADVVHKYVKMYCDTNQFPKLTFCGSNPKPHIARGLIKHYHLRFDPKLGHGICRIFRIPYACVSYTSMIEKPWISGIQSTKQARYQPVTKCTYW